MSRGRRNAQAKLPPDHVEFFYINPSKGNRERQFVDLRSGETGHGEGCDPLVVWTKQLSPEITRWLKWYQRNHPNKWRSSDLEGEGLAALAERVGSNPRSLWRVWKCESRVTAFGFADRLLTAMNRAHLLTDEIRPFRNPQWSKARFEAWKEGNSSYEPNEDLTKIAV